MKNIIMAKGKVPDALLEVIKDTAAVIKARKPESMYVRDVEFLINMIEHLKKELKKGV